jgi:hypothetical protein
MKDIQQISVKQFVEINKEVHNGDYNNNGHNGNLRSTTENNTKKENAASNEAAFSLYTVCTKNLLIPILITNLLGQFFDLTS